MYIRIYDESVLKIMSKMSQKTYLLLDRSQWRRATDGRDTERAEDEVARAGEMTTLIFDSIRTTAG